MTGIPIVVGADTYDGMWDAAAAAGDPLASIEQVEEIFRHDGFIVDIVKDGAESVWLRNTVRNDDPGGEGARRVEITTHFLAFPDAETLKATLHDDMAPTIESYETASHIVEQVISYETRNGGPSTEHRYRTEEKVLDRIDEAHLPYRQLRPGRRMTFGPLQDFLSMTAKESAGLYRYPVPQDEIVVHHDCVRAWIGRFPEAGGRPLIHLVTCVRDDPGIWMQDRLGFAPEAEAAMRATLAAGQAPTMDTYRMAVEIHRETIDTSSPSRPTLTVEKMRPDDLGAYRPSYDDVAQHDREWPAFAVGRKGE